MNPAPLSASKPEPDSPFKADNRSSAFQPATERFDTFMGRALARPDKKAQQETDKLSRSDEKERKTRKSDSVKDPGVAEEAVVAMVPVVPPPTPTATAVKSDVSDPSDPSEGSTELAPIAATAPAPPSASEPEATHTETPPATNQENAAPTFEGLTPEPNPTPEEPETSPPTAIDSLSPPVPEASDEGHGIYGAKYDSPMQKAEKMNEFSGSAEQKLPAEGGISTGTELPMKAPRPVRSLLATENTIAPSFSLTSSTTTSTEVSSASFLQEPSAASLPSLERTHELMSLQAVRLRESGNDSLRVVIKPDAGLHLSLDLQMRDGNVEMRALLHQGDFDLLSRHWNELQQQLEARGIRLAPLVSGEASADSQFNFSQQPGERRTEDQNESLTALSLASVINPKTASRTPSRGWESWA